MLTLEGKSFEENGFPDEGKSHASNLGENTCVGKFSRISKDSSVNYKKI